MADLPLAEKFVLRRIQAGLSAPYPDEVRRLRERGLLTPSGERLTEAGRAFIAAHPIVPASRATREGDDA